ncbi:MAG TPA: choice-of-anchor tandem repeat GloVer-containing protein, partial [Methylocella sp.]
MQYYKGKRRSALLRGGFAALCAALAVAAAGSASAAPTETVLHSFTGSDGANPDAGLIADNAGNLYGTTSNGGAFGQGVVFKLSPGGTETVLHSFTGGDGATTSSPLPQNMPEFKLFD